MRVVLPQVVTLWQVVLAVSVPPLRWRASSHGNGGISSFSYLLMVYKACLFLQNLVKYVLSFPILWYLLFYFWKMMGVFTFGMTWICHPYLSLFNLISALLCTCRFVGPSWSTCRMKCTPKWQRMTKLSSLLLFPSLSRGECFLDSTNKLHTTRTYIFVYNTTVQNYFGGKQEEKKNQ